MRWHSVNDHGRCPTCGRVLYFKDFDFLVDYCGVEYCRRCCVAEWNGSDYRVVKGKPLIMLTKVQVVD